MFLKHGNGIILLALIKHGFGVLTHAVGVLISVRPIGDKKGECNIGRAGFVLDVTKQLQDLGGSGLMLAGAI